MEQQNTNRFGFISSDGYFQKITALTTASLEFAYKSSQELEMLLQENVVKERYETCAVIRDELIKRQTA